MLKLIHVLCSIISFRRETICDALAQTEWRNFVSNFFSSPQMHARWQHHMPHIPGGGGGGSGIFDAESKSVVKNFSLYQALWT